MSTLATLWRTGTTTLLALTFLAGATDGRELPVGFDLAVAEVLGALEVERATFSSGKDDKEEPGYTVRFLAAPLADLRGFIARLEERHPEIQAAQLRLLRTKDSEQADLWAATLTLTGTPEATSELPVSIGVILDKIDKVRTALPSIRFRSLQLDGRRGNLGSPSRLEIEVPDFKAGAEIVSIAAEQLKPWTCFSTFKKGRGGSAMTLHIRIP